MDSFLPWAARAYAISEHRAPKFRRGTPRIVQWETATHTCRDRKLTAHAAHTSGQGRSLHAQCGDELHAHKVPSTYSHVTDSRHESPVDGASPGQPSIFWLSHDVPELLHHEEPTSVHEPPSQTQRYSGDPHASSHPRSFVGQASPSAAGSPAGLGSVGSLATSCPGEMA